MNRRIFFPFCAFTTLVFLFPSPVRSEPKGGGTGFLEKTSLDGAQQNDKQKAVRTVYDEGFTLLGEDDAVKLGVWMQNDARIFFNNRPGTTQFLVRRARIDLRGSLEGMFGFKLMGEFEGDNGTNAANLKEGWVEYNQFSAFRVRIGQYKEPYGLENLYGDLWTDFLERPIAENFIRPEQDLGLMFYGKLFGKRLEYGIGLFNGSGTNVAEVNDDKDVAGRLSVTPWAGSGKKWLDKFTLGGSLTYGKQTATLDGTGPTTAMGTRVLAFVSPTAGGDVTVSGNRLRAGGDLEWLVGPFSLKGEYALSRLLGVTFGGVRRSFDIHGAHLQATYLLTGEDKTNQGAIVPKHPFNPKEGGLGAVELTGRFETMWAEQGLIDAGFAAGTDDLWSATGGVNWILNRHIRTSANYVFSKFDDAVVGAGGRTDEHGILLRVQFNL